MKLSELKDKSVLIWGLGKEGLAALNAIKDISCKIYLYDDNISNSKTLSLPSSVKIVKSPITNTYDVLIKSPGVSIYKDEIKKIKTKGTHITSGTQLWFNENLPGTKICITGTKGKSTSVTLLTHILNKLGKSAKAVGNIGNPLLDTLNLKEKPKFWIIELSSFQIYDLKAKPDITLLLNLYAAHLDWHLSLENYRRDKFHLFNLSSNKKYINKLDPESLKKSSKHKNISYFNDKEHFHFKDDHIYFKDKKLNKITNFSLLGDHNLSNICGIFSILQELFPKTDLNFFVEHANSFIPLPHRLNKVSEKDGIIYVDDSISTINEATIAAVKALKDFNITLIFGGKDMKIEFKEQISEILAPNVKTLVGLPDTGHQLIDSLSNQNEKLLLKAFNMKEAVTLAKNNTKAGEVILLSPGAQSLNMFKNYIDRGEQFVENI